MATVIKLKRSETGSSVPSTSDLAVGEVAINTVDQKIYVRDSSNNIITVANYSTGGSGSVRTELDGGRADSIYNSSQTLDAGSAVQ